MTTVTSLNSKNPTIKRVLREARELSTNPSSEFTAAPLETNLLEWHFTLKGPPAPSPFAGGIYHGRIVLPPSYPLRPPSFRFLTPSGRFEVNREICLSISGFHEESWQPAWGIRTALVAIRSFMESDPGGQVGGVVASKAVREKLAVESKAWKCASCGSKTNEEVIKQLDEDVEAGEGQVESKEEAVPEELRLGYRDELGKDKEARSEPKKDNPAMPEQSNALHQHVSPSPLNVSANSHDTPSTAGAATTQQQPPTTTTTSRQPVRRDADDASTWVDMAIAGIAATLILMVIRKLVHYI